MDKHFAFLIAVLIDRLRDFPEEPWKELFAALDTIERKYDLLRPLSDADREAIEESKRSIKDGKGIPMEELEIFKDLKNYDHTSSPPRDPSISRRRGHGDYPTKSRVFPPLSCDDGWWCIIRE